jgi:hypothetical protein
MGAAIVFKTNLTIEFAQFVSAGAPVQPRLATEGYPAAAGTTLLPVPLIQVADGARLTVQPRQPPVVHLPADLVSNLVAHGIMVSPPVPGDDRPPCLKADESTSLS